MTNIHSIAPLGAMVKHNSKMLELGIKLAGLTATTEALKKLFDEKKQEAIVREIALAIEYEAKRLCPVDTGRLRASITTEKIDTATYGVGTNVEYARAVELGSEDPNFNRAPQPYLRPALHKNEKVIRQMFKKII